MVWHSQCLNPGHPAHKANALPKSHRWGLFKTVKECLSDSVTNYTYVGDTKVSVSIKKINANKCTLSEIFLSEILKSFSAF